MFLEEVIIEGFKSYATRAGISFKPGIGVIVGNNGVGKSNILDAIAWCLGENDPGRLRCGGRRDLFFSGAGEYPEAQTARVEIIFKPAGGKNALSVKLARQTGRQGEEAFFIDGAAVSPQSYQEKINGLGLKDSVKTIIRQEKINDFLNMTPGERYHHLSVITGRRAPEEMAAGLDTEFRQLFRILIPDGDAAIYPSRREEGPGLVVEASFPGKGMKSSTLLSGGEKTICSLALQLAIFNRMASPFYLFDEVEPSLDWANHRHMQALLKKLADKKQLIMITHLRSTVELADTVHGIRARRDGTSFIKFYFEMNERLLRAYKCC